MPEPDETVALPDDWREHENWLELVLAALVAAYKADDIQPMLQFIDIGHEFSERGLAAGAVAIAQVVARRLLGAPPTELKAAPVTELGPLPGLVEQLAETQPDSELYGNLLLLCAQLYRRAGRHDVSLAAYEAAVAMFDRLGLHRSAAVARQGLGAVSMNLGALDRAEHLTRQAETAFSELADARGLIEARLNLVQYALVRDDIDQAASLIAALTGQAHEMRDGHYVAALLFHSAAIDIHQGDPAGARTKLRKALRSCRRRQDTDLELRILQNLASLARETGGARAARHWAAQALRRAHESADREQEQAFARSLAIDLVDVGSYGEAVALFERAVELNVELDHPLEVARSRADLGAVLLSHAFELTTSADDESAREKRDRTLDAAVSTLTAAFEALDESDDYDWAMRAAQNLQIAWTAQGSAEAGADELARRAQRSIASAPAYAGSLLRIAAFLGLTATQDGARAREQLTEAAALAQAEPGERAWQLVADAERIARSYGDRDTALTLYDLALETLRMLPDQVGYANALNDSALLAADLDRTEDARARLLEVEAYAVRAENRVLGAMAKTNLGEMAIREGRHVKGRAYLTAAAELAEAVGDVEQASTDWASVANSYVSDPPDLDAAAAAASRAADLAGRSGSSDATARALSAQGSISFSRGNYLTSYDLWRAASRAHDGERSATYLGFALAALAQLGDWPRYSRALDRFTRTAQRSGVQLQFADQLWDSAMTWLRTSSARRAAKPLAYSILLAADGYSTRSRDPFDEDRVAGDFSAIVSTAKALFIAGTVLELEETPPATRDVLLRHVTRELTKVVGADDAQMLLAQVTDVGRWVEETEP